MVTAIFLLLLTKLRVFAFMNTPFFYDKRENWGREKGEA